MQTCNKHYPSAGKYMYKNCKSVLEGHWTDGYLSHGKWTLPNGRNLFVFFFQSYCIAICWSCIFHSRAPFLACLHQRSSHPGKRIYSLLLLYFGSTILLSLSMQVYISLGTSDITNRREKVYGFLRTKRN
ncbi:conserved Plasmodium protein, unknown function [Plasmodium ovale wallikeri]|uniref:Uncharacterized protein n=1 Tax=Plasmodium ovale wallikeri TaxID=864142 RepID=A0A1A8YR24_PLAOA|nr:conserved Plasmodium protein, unknown function [Plasmodium ovale wallikeri]SBT34564.1 conserved Plasmodium protein, unknown function [Plasmodium ovale wallikeri]